MPPAQAMPDPQIDLFQGIPLFGGLSEATLKLLLERSPVIRVPKGEYFFREGNDAVGMYVLQAGKVVILKTWQGHDYVLRHLGPKDCFGEMAIMDLSPRSASVLATEDSQAIELSGSVLDEVYKADPAQYTLVQMNMGREVSRRLRESNRLLFEAKVEAKLIDGNLLFFTT